MNDKDSNGIDGLIKIRQFRSSDSFDLIDAGFPYGYDVLKRFSGENFLQKINLVPRETRLVVYHIRKQRVIGFLSLLAHNRLLYSIRYVFSDPNFRQMGVATSLINYALNLAKNKGAEKIFLTSDADPLSSASRLYQKLGFRIISSNPILKGNGNTSNFQTEKVSSSFTISLSSRISYDPIFDVYKKSLGEELIDFFGINRDNFINGISQDFQHFFMKNVFINNSRESVALVFNLPFTRTATAELYSKSPSLTNDLIVALNKNLIERGTKHLTISSFNAKTDLNFDLLSDKKFHPYRALIMGRSL